MSLIKKLREWRVRHKVAAAIMEGATLYAGTNAAVAAVETFVQPQQQIVETIVDTVIPSAQADYFDGCRGPEMFQLDQRVTLSEGTPGYTLLPKVFIDQNEDGHSFFGVTPFMYTPGQKPAVGVGAGMFVDLGEHVKMLGVVPVVYNTEGEALNINPTVYATIMAGKFLIDPRVSYLASINEQGTTHNLAFGTTVGLMIDNVVIGGDVETAIDPANAQSEQLEGNLKYGGIIRVDLDKQHKNWMQAYFGKDSVTVGFRANF
ncbi:hypothetical protein HN695_08070 [Candidatus Woesearchaeota archaeon]|jgi:hypothetical protein|nr:hypothetical protein [Candidatus Woesearchaeota archaeon]MBT5272497.1 hypothetical protein [Candidatus Woesearchaeota archaeon]MBT6041495.1 hypothetical protein [Candidatus Woesearchaeota archaeon]MBT6336359.1 hypothetical protein [Candidatus Woesearchaeota archaeon]MBT7928261.1 hypothetical protein [Candidatus Woesearchaeota archaeon]